MSIKIGIDLLSSENTPEDILKSILQFAKKNEKNVEYVFFAKNDIKPKLEEIKKSFSSDCEIVYAEHIIEMDDDPLFAIRRKKDSSICKAMDYLKDEKMDAFISCGNTGALMMSATMIVGTLKNISRPALLAMIPTKSNLTAVLDVGASVNYTKDDLVHFAILGASFQKALNISKPKVGLLNIGTEEKKGTSHHQKAYLELLKIQDSFEFIGNIEGNNVFEGKVDVLVTDGFTGNVFLKTSEGIVSFLIDKIYEKFENKIILKDTEKVLNEIKKRLYYAQYPGALLIGAKKIIIKCHGYSSIKSIISAVEGAIEFAQKDIISSIDSFLE
ncbi:MAG: phosphate acyltransferase PlsX [Parachlamydiales bacterium]|nr:phosphate acyltransferase PlsX [Parachlamydiales bacterium]